MATGVPPYLLYQFPSFFMMIFILCTLLTTRNRSLRGAFFKLYASNVFCELLYNICGDAMRLTDYAYYAPRVPYFLLVCVFVSQYAYKVMIIGTMLIACNRYTAVIEPFNYEEKWNCGRVKIYILCAHVLSALLSAPILFSAPNMVNIDGRLAFLGMTPAFEKPIRYIHLSVVSLVTLYGIPKSFLAARELTRNKEMEKRYERLLVIVSIIIYLTTFFVLLCQGFKVLIVTIGRLEYTDFAQETNTKSVFILGTLLSTRNPSLNGAFFKLYASNVFCEILYNICADAMRLTHYFAYAEYAPRGLVVCIFICQYSYKVMTFGTMLIACNRYTAVVTPFVYGKVWSLHRVKIYIIWAHILSILLSSPVLLSDANLLEVGGRVQFFGMTPEFEKPIRYIHLSTIFLASVYGIPKSLLTIRAMTKKKITKKHERLLVVVSTIIYVTTFAVLMCHCLKVLAVTIRKSTEVAQQSIYILMDIHFAITWTILLGSNHHLRNELRRLFRFGGFESGWTNRSHRVSTIMMTSGIVQKRTGST